MEDTLKACLPEHTAPLHLAIGIDMGATLVSVSVSGCIVIPYALGEPWSAGQIGISRRVRKALPAEIRRHFAPRGNKQRFVATYPIGKCV